MHESPEVIAAPYAPRPGGVQCRTDGRASACEHEGMNQETTALRPVTCPLCHTPSALTATAVEAGSEWQCVRCGQQWDTARLAALANYALWQVEHDRRVGLQDAGLASIWEAEGRTRESDEAVAVH